MLSHKNKNPAGQTDSAPTMLLALSVKLMPPLAGAEINNKLNSLSTRLDRLSAEFSEGGLSPEEPIVRRRKSSVDAGYCEFEGEEGWHSPGHRVSVDDSLVGTDR